MAPILVILVDYIENPSRGIFSRHRYCTAPFNYIIAVRNFENCRFVSGKTEETNFLLLLRLSSYLQDI